jgi:hypothetical protein
MSSTPNEDLFSRKHAGLEDHEVFSRVEELEPIQTAYVAIDEIGIDPDRKLWLPRVATVFPAEEALLRSQNAGDDLCRVIILPHLKWLDLSAGAFSLGGELPGKFEVEPEVEFQTEQWFRVNRVIRTADERQFIEAAIQNKFKRDIGTNVLAISHLEIDEDFIDETSEGPFEEQG